MAGKRILSIPVVAAAVSEAEQRHRWFAPRGCVEWVGPEDARVYVGGTLIGTFAGKRDRTARNAILIGLLSDPDARRYAIAAAFDIAYDTLRTLERAVTSQGVEAAIRRAPGGAHFKVTPSLRARLEKLFAAGKGDAEAFRALGKKPPISIGTVANVRKAWVARIAPAPAPSTSTSSTPAPQLSLPSEVAPPTPPAPPAEDGPTSALEVKGGESIQHLGTWLMIALVAHFGLHREAEAATRGRVSSVTLRVVLDALIAALAVGERCVEGVRRLATSSAPLLLRALGAPSASWVRRVLHETADEHGGGRVHLAMAKRYAEEARGGDDEPAVFYVDNHMRRYTGNKTVRHGWRMQDKRAVPGTSDYYVHDEDGRPLLRVAVPEHGALTDWLTPLGLRLREMLGEGQRILLAFDRAGAFATQLAELRDHDIELVTYERRPFPMLTSSAFSDTIELGDETYGISETRLHNLGKGRGRVRRISLRTEDERQVNLLAVSTLPAARLAEIVRGRWVQENAFKHGAARWGINQLDSRKTEPYDPATLVPNPARRRLDRALRIARVREGDARRELAKLDADDPRRAAREQELAEALALQASLEDQRPSLPKKAPLAETDLAGRLVYHPDDYKMLIDTVRIACANAEADLAGELAPHLEKPAEAKRLLRNLLAAPGRLRVGAKTIAVDLRPAANAEERAAIGEMMRVVNRWQLTLPGDERGRRLRFRSPE
jgi:hypothetical protein